MVRTAQERPATVTAGCWRHTAVVGDTSCERCGVRCCQHCWVGSRQGSLCIECALEIAGVRVRRRRVPRGGPTADSSPLAGLSWEQSADLIDLAPAHRRTRPDPVLRDFFRRAA